MSDGRIDWEEVHRRMEAAGAALESGYAPGPEQGKFILKKRAEELAREQAENREEEFIEVVEFLLANERYGLESRFIREVYPLKDFTPLPGVPPFVLGLVNVRGRILSVIDIRKFFDLPRQGISDLNKIIIVNDEKMEFAILADAILGVRHIALSGIGPPLPTLTGIRGEYLKGITGERMVILDAGRILADEDIVVHEEV